MTNPDNVGGLFYPSGDDVDQMIELAIQCGIDNRGTSWPVTLCRLRAKVRAELCRAAPAGGDDHLRRLVGKLDQWRLSMSYNDSYFGEPAGLLKSTVEELARAVDPIYPPKPAPKDPLAGVTIYSATVTLSAAARDGE